MKKRMLFACAALVLAGCVAGAADTSLLPNPLKNVREGQWVSYTIVIMGVEAEQKQTVAAITGEGDERQLTMKLEIIVDGQVMQSDEQVVTYAEATQDLMNSFDDDPDITIEPVKVEVKGQEVDGVVVTFKEDDTLCRLYLSEEVPVVGIVKMEIEGMEGEVMRVKDFEK